MKGYCVETIFENINYKLENSIPLTKEDLIPLALCPLMSGNLSQKERIQKALHIVKDSKQIAPDVDKIEAVIYAMASKFLNSTELNQIKEELKMTELGLLLYNDGKADGIKQGIQQASLDAAQNLFDNNASFDLVRKSIKDLSDESLQKIYNEVKASKENDQKN